MLMDSLHLRLHRMRDVLRRHMGQGEDVAVRSRVYIRLLCDVLHLPLAVLRRHM